MELKGDVTRQRRLEAIDKLLSVLTLIVGAVFGLQALGLDGELCACVEGEGAHGASGCKRCGGVCRSAGASLCGVA